MLPVYKIWHTLLSTRILLSKLLLSFLKRTYVSRNALNLNLLNYNMKILQVAFLLLFNYLDSLPKLYTLDFNSKLSYYQYHVKYRWLLNSGHILDKKTRRKPGHCGYFTIRMFVNVCRTLWNIFHQPWIINF